MDNQTKLDTFVSVTGESNIEKVFSILDSLNWDLDKSINLYNNTTVRKPDKVKKQRLIDNFSDNIYNTNNSFENDIFNDNIFENDIFENEIATDNITTNITTNDITTDNISADNIITNDYNYY